MTNLQLLLTIGIPSVFVVLSWLSNNSGRARLEKNVDDGFNRVDQRIGGVDQRLLIIESDLRRFY